MLITLLKRAGLATGLLTALLPLLAAPAQAHHLMDVNSLTPTVLNGLLSGLAHPVIGADHLVFLLALALLGLQHRQRWMIALLAVALLGSAVGLFWPSLPGQELWIGGTLVLEALVLLRRIPALWMLPAMALHGYVLSQSVLGWSAMPLGSYLAGLLIAQTALLVLSLSWIQSFTRHWSGLWMRRAAYGLIGFGALWTMAQVLA